MMQASPKNTAASRRKSVNPCMQFSSKLFGFFSNGVLPLFFQKATVDASPQMPLFVTAEKRAEVLAPEQALPLCSEQKEVKEEEGEDGDWEEVVNPGMSLS